MKYGLLAKALIVVGDEQKVYTVDNKAKQVTININVACTGAIPTKVKISISDKDQPTVVDIVEPGRVLQPDDVFERTSLCCSGGESVFVLCDNPGVVVRIHGLENVLLD